MAGIAEDSPLTVAECAKQAKEYVFDPELPLKIYIRSFSMLFREANIYWNEGQWARAYILMYRASDLVLDKLGTHPESKTHAGRRMIKGITPQATQVIDSLEKLKPLVEACAAEGVDVHRSSVPQSARTTVMGDFKHSPTVVDPGDQLGGEALDKIIRTVNQRAASWSLPHPQVQKPNERHSSKVLPIRHPLVDDTQSQMEAVRRQLDSMHVENPSTDDEISALESHPAFAPSYPVLHQSKPIELGALLPEHPDPSHRLSWNQTPPERPAKAPVNPSSLPHPRLPPRLPPRVSAVEEGGASLDLQSLILPSKPVPTRPPKLESSVNNVTPPPHKPPISSSTPSVPSATFLPKKEYVFKMASKLESGEKLRSLFIPSKLRETFLRIAQPNTNKGLELCGLLCGSLASNALFVTHLLIPQQECTENTCEATNEEEIIEFCEQHDLILMGWIHTHPTQTCFLSSRDLHTHAPYQCQLVESVAIVCAPRYQQYGIFRCTDPPGKQMLLKCREAGVFHLHSMPDDQLYVDARAPNGHVAESPSIEVMVTDMRPKHERGR